MGLNKAGELGVCEPIENSPTPLKGLNLFYVVSISSQDSHSSALTRAGEIYTWGYNSCGELGTEDLKIRRSPHKVHIDWSQSPISRVIPSRIISATCGRTHTLALTNHGDVLAWGSNDLGQLGLRQNLKQFNHRN